MNQEDFQRYHLPKPCMFCANMAGYSPLKEMDRLGVGIYFCHKCQAEYLYYQSGHRASVSLYTTVNGKMYRWTVGSDQTAVLWYVANPGIPGEKVNENLKLLKSFDEQPLPDITPDNIANKIRVWLPFL